MGNREDFENGKIQPFDDEQSNLTEKDLQIIQSVENERESNCEQDAIMTVDYSNNEDANRKMPVKSEYSISPSRYMARKRIERKVSNRRINARKMSRKDWLTVFIILLITSLVTFINFGTTNVPESYWETEKSNEYVVVKTDDYAKIRKAWIYPGIPKDKAHSYTISIYSGATAQLQNATILGTRVVEEGEMYRWQEMKLDNVLAEGKYLFVVANSNKVRLNELVFTDSNNAGIDVVVQGVNTVSKNCVPSEIFDEQSSFPKFSAEKTSSGIVGQDGKVDNYTPSYYLTDMYFDEIYHARTAFEHIQGWEPYEITHPPLGKIMIGWGIRVFGMNPVGWRIVCTIFSILSVGLIYMLGKQMFKRRLWSILLSVLFMCDGLRFVQGRIATLDSIVTFFIMLSYYFMLKFIYTNYNKQGIIKALIPFACAGVSFGISVAVKWTGIYSGIGLLVLFLIYLKRRYDEYAIAKKCLRDDEVTTFNSEKISSTYMANSIYLFVSALVFFLIIPFVIYLLSYIPYLVNGKTSLWAVMIENQKTMLGYHSALTQTHPWQSQWWTWPLSLRSVFFYCGDSSFGSNIWARVYTVGNPLLYFFAMFAVGYYVVYFIKKYNQKEFNIYNSRKYIQDRNLIIFLVIAICANYLPWLLISRATFVYHFYPTVPFLLCVLVMFMREMVETKTEKMFNIGKTAVSKGTLIVSTLIALVVINFALFYPAYSGVPVSASFAKFAYGWFYSFNIF